MALPSQIEYGAPAVREGYQALALDRDRASIKETRAHGILRRDRSSRRHAEDKLREVREARARIERALAAAAGTVAEERFAEQLKAADRELEHRTEVADRAREKEQAAEQAWRQASADREAFDNRMRALVEAA